LAMTTRGFGFVERPDGPDIFVPSENLYTALDGDLVAAEILREPADRNPVGRVVRVTERARREIVGVFKKEDGRAIVVPEDERLKKPLSIARGRGKKRSGALTPAEGAVVVAEFIRWEDPEELPQGRVIEILGKPDDPSIDARIVARVHNLPREFPREVERSLRKMKPSPIRDELSRRKDLRSTVCVTIDPDDAKDFDDAVSLVQLPNGCYELGVHIADVSFYVPEGGPIDREAARRGTSVYFVRDVIPMLPERLSNHLCSLRPGEDRPALSIIMSIDSRGDVKKYRIVESVIRSSRRFTYREVEDIIGGATDPLAKTIHNMMMLSTILRHRREETGSVDFDSTEPVFSLDENGIPYEVRPSERLDANRLIEEFMLIANRTVARHVAAKNAEAAASGPRRGSRRTRRSDASPFPFIYRIHEKPDDADVRSLLNILERLGISYRVDGELTPDDYRKLLDIVENLPFKDFVEKAVLRSMTKAVYATENRGHFGLAFDAYTHFTSPIRRYPDLVVHRLLKRYADGPPEAPERLAAALDEVCKTCSARERAAIAAEREYTRLKSMEFLANKVGGVYDGVISGVTSFGLFVELTHYLIEGLVHVSEMTDDWYEYDGDEYQLRGRESDRTYRLGDPVRVKIKDVSVEEKKADFSLVSE